MTADTVQTILDDEQLRRTYRAVVTVCVDTSRSLADRLEMPELSTLSNSLDSHLRELNSRADAGQNVKRAGLLDTLLPGGGQAQGDSMAKAGGGGLFGGLLSGGGKGGPGGFVMDAISQAASGVIGRVINMTGPAVAGAGFFGGVGAGVGAAQGLNLVSADMSMDTAATVAQENGMKSSGFNSAIESAAMGLTATALRALRQGNVLQLPDLGPVAEALGGGLGNGAATGLKLTTALLRPPVNGSGLDGLAGNFAFGLSKSLTESTNTSNLLGQIGGQTGSSMTDMLLKLAGPAASGLGKGLGSGTAVGLGLRPDATTVRAINADGSVDISGVAQDFASGLTSQFLANGTATKAFNSLSSGQNQSSVTDMLLKFAGPGAAGLGKGLGSGAAVGLGLQPDAGSTTTASMANADGSVDVSGVAQDFASGLTSRFLANGTATKAFNSLSSGQNQSSVTDMLLRLARPAASGLGKGLGSGAAVGLGLQPDAGSTTVETAKADGSIDVSGVAQDFASGLTSRFLANGTATKAINGLTGGNGGGLGANLDVGRIANGLARGLLAGVGDGAQSLGGVNAIISGKAAVQPSPAPETQVTFNDSVGGAATGFGQGLGSSAVVTVQKLLSGGGGGLNKLKRSASPASRVARQAPPAGLEPVGLNISSLLSPEAISSVVQTLVDALTCEGVGGLFLVTQGLRTSSTISAGGLDPSTVNFIKDLVPQGLISFSKDGNTYEIDGKQLSKALDGSISEAADGVYINGVPFKRSVTLLLVHIFFAVIAFTVMLPLAMTLYSSRNILLRLQADHVLPSWTLTATKVIWNAGIAPLGIIVLIFGLLPGPRGAHFQTAHGILGLISLLVTVAAVPLYTLATLCTPLASIKKVRVPTISLGCNQLLLVLTVPTLITGFLDLSRVSQCVTRVVPFELAILLGLLLGSMLVIGQAVSVLDILSQWLSSGRKSKPSQTVGSWDASIKKSLSG